HRKLVDLSYQISTPCNSINIFKINDKIFDIFCTSKHDASHVTLSGRAVKGLCSLNIDGDQNTKAWTINNESGSDVSWLTDNDDKTCNNGNIQSITVTLQKPRSVSLVRFTVRSAEYTDQFRLSYTASSQRFRACDNPRSAMVDDKTVDISCPTFDVVSHVRLSGNIVRELCSLFISGGRNVALKQSSSQSSTYNKGGITWSASNAVDGHPGIPDDITSLRSTCSHTIPDNSPMWWNLTFTDPVKITKLSIYNRRDCCEHRLVNFTIQAFSNTGSSQAVYSYTDPGGPAQQVYTVVPSPQIDVPVGKVSFDVTKNTYKDNILTLCEVYIFGEVVCPPGKFGRQCERNCNCVDQTEACFVSTGGCPSGCAAGYTGEDCYTQVVCPPGKFGRQCERDCNCVDQTEACFVSTGGCPSGCAAGFTGEDCYTHSTLEKEEEDGGKEADRTISQRGEDKEI
ncbi:receptor-type tyrosine-protein phosphatase kappa-like, partial [Plakobranchus ocellatus]